MRNIILKRFKPNSYSAAAFAIFINPFGSKLCKAGIVYHSKILIFDQSKFQRHITSLKQFIQIFCLADCLCYTTIQIIVIYFTVQVKRDMDCSVLVCKILTNKSDPISFCTMRNHCPKLPSRKV